SWRQCALTVSVLSLAVATAFGATSASAVGQMGSLDIISRSNGQVLSTYLGGGRYWVVGTPGQEYSFRYCNSTPGRVLAVMSVDGVNVVSGDTAAPSQSGYVLGPYECADIQGWRKSMTRTAAFYFTELPDAYATRTGRPENVGVIGVAVFREQRRIAWRAPIPKSGATQPSRGAPAASEPASPYGEPYAQDRRERSDSASSSAEAEGKLEAAPSQSMARAPA